MSKIIRFINKYSAKQYAILKISIINNNPDFIQKYISHIDKHNNSIINDEYPNSGFNLLIPKDNKVPRYKSTIISLDIKCEMINHENITCGFFIFPNLSISKTPLLISSFNNGQIINPGYRGILNTSFRNLDLNNKFIIKKNSKLLQITHPSLCPIYVKVVNEYDLFLNK